MLDVIRHDESDCIFLGEFSQQDADAGAVIVDPCSLPAGTRIATTLGHSEVLPSMDFETYSEAGFVIGDKVKGTGSGGKSGLPAVGTPVYAEHPSTEVLSLYYDLKDGKGRRRWLPGMPDPTDLLSHIASGGLIEAWNITFEFWIWNMVCVRKLGWPPLPLTQCRCAMAKAKRHSLPGSLDNAAKVLGTPQKDKDGKRLLDKLSRPHTPTKQRLEHRWTPATAWEDFCKLYDYNEGDVVAEDHASARIPDLTPYELDVWLMDQTINARGVQVDIETLDKALDILGQAERKYTMELAKITQGAVGSVSEVAKFVDWLATLGVRAPNMQKDTVAELLKDPALPPIARRALEIRDGLGAANVKKLRALKLQVSSDGRLRDQYRYCGADRTGRWAAGGVQLQNITARGPKLARCEDNIHCGKLFGADVSEIGCPRCGSWMWHEEPEWTIEGVEQAIEDIRTGSLEHVEKMWGAPIAVLCGVLRGLFMAAPGKKLVCCDFSAIEAVAAACLARCDWRIEVFSTPGECIYTRSAAKITGTPMSVYKQYKQEHGTHHPDRKKIGKIAELACFGPRTQVLTRRGYVSIAEVKQTDELWDGVEWVKHQGVVNKGKRNTLELDGVTVTPEHPVSLKSSWKEARELALNPSTLRRALEIGSESLPSLDFNQERKNAARSLLVAAAARLFSAHSRIFTKESRPAASGAGGIKRVRPMSRSTASTRTSFLMLNTVGGWLIGCALLLRVAIHRPANSTQTMAAEVSQCTTVGAGRTAPLHSFNTSSRWSVGTTRLLKWTAETLTATTKRATSGLLRAVRTWPISARFAQCKPESTSWSTVYDVVNAGPRNRFTIKTDSGHLIVHNSGYGGWVNAWKAFGCDMDDQEIKEQVLAWREASPEIVEMWGGEYKWCGPGKWDYRPELHGLEGAAMQAIMNPGTCYSHHDITYGVADDILFCRLPSGRYLHYHKPRLIPTEDKLNRGPAHTITFEGYNSNADKGHLGWCRMETFGGRLFENVVQAVSCDIQAEALLRLERNGYSVVMHTHDEGCAEVPDDPAYNVERMEAIMSERPTWASWWPIRAAGWEHTRYQKD